jgi:hypothetical protein
MNTTKQTRRISPMMHPFDELLSVVGCFFTCIGILAGILCSQPWVMWCAGCGLGAMLTGMGLDKWREWKREKKNSYYW